MRLFALYQRPESDQPFTGLTGTGVPTTRNLARRDPKLLIRRRASFLLRDYRVTRQRGELQKSAFGPMITVTVHPSSILRAPDDEARHLQMREFVADLKKIARALPDSALIKGPG